MKLEFISRK